MHARILFAVGLLLAGTTFVGAQDVILRPAKIAPPNATITLGQPTPLSVDGAPQAVQPVVRGQIGDPPPPTPPPFPGGAGVVVGVPNNNAVYDRGMVNNDSDLGSFWTRTGDGLKRCWDDITGNAAGAFQGGAAGRQPFQSDHAFDVFSSPTTNPYFFSDPRALTEIRPVFIWQNTPNNNPVLRGGNDFDYAFVGSVAITENISIVINRLGFTTIAPHDNPTLGTNTGFSELMLGPKLTFYRNEATQTVAAVGLIFDIPDGSGAVFQNTGHLMLDPYFSIAQNFGKNPYGSFNFMNTTGYTFRTDNTRTEALFSSFHLDYEIGKRFWPFIELNWRLYTRSGGENDVGFEGNDLANLGAEHIAGQNELNLAFGTRIKLNNFIFWGIAAEFNVLPNGSGQHLDQFRLTTDLIFRY
jgi:hypothetical protein